MVQFRWVFECPHDSQCFVDNILSSAVPIGNRDSRSGLINYREAFKAALSVGFQGILCTEHYGGDGLSVTASNQDYLRRQVLPKTDRYALGKSQVAQGRQQPAGTHQN